MSTKEVISIRGLSKSYPMYARPWDMAKELITGRRYSDDFWALKDISFSVFEKQRIGIIGPNGAGKTTLLKIITGNLAQTFGSINIFGKVSAMLSLASSLNPEETGLNNIRFNLLINGCKKADIENLVEEIIEFTELGPFIYAPVKTYSTGMNARLAFAITTAIKPEILVVDEVLSVGDSYFVGKAMKRMISICEQGKALIFVSHSTAAVQMLCDTVIWLDNGSIRAMGPAEHILRTYEEDYKRREDEMIRKGNIRRRNVSAGNAQASEIGNPDLNRIRIASSRVDKVLEDIYYVRKITVCTDALGLQDVNLSGPSTQDMEENVFLDLHGSEWGGSYSKEGFESRILCAQSGKNRGGHVVVKKPSLACVKFKLTLRFEYASILGKNELIGEFINYKTGKWESGTIASHSKLSDGWEAIVIDFEIPVVDDAQYGQVVKCIEENSRPSIEIMDVAVSVDGNKTHVVDERQPFQIDVKIFAHRLVPKTDVSIVIFRSDGVYIFWQTSGINGGNLDCPEGEIIVSFDFKENIFSQGEYYINAVCANGWDFENNYPHSEIFDRKFRCYEFLVRPEFPGLDFGVINMRVPVKCKKMKSIQKHENYSKNNK